MKFSGGCIGKALSAILCIILGFVLAFASIGLAGYIVLTKKGMVGVVAEKAGSTVPLNFDDETKAKSLLVWGKELYAGVKNINTGTIGEIESLAGVDAISKTVEKMIGVPASVIKASTLENLASTISENLTMENAKTKFNIAFPDMPIFKDPTFLASPLATALQDFNEHKLNEVIEITADGNAVLKKLGNIKIKDLGGATTDIVVKSTTLGEMMTIKSTSSRILNALKYNCIESQYTDETETTYKTAMLPVLDAEGKPTFDVNDNPILVTRDLIGINDRINTLVMNDILEITEASNVILRKMRTPTQAEIDDGKQDLFGTEDLLLNELGGAKLTAIIDTTTLGELITIDETSEPIMQALASTSIENINTRIATLHLNEIFRQTELDGGALSLIPSDTLLNNIPSAMTTAMLNSTVATLKQKEVLAANTFNNIDSMKFEQRAFVYNSNMSDLLGGMIDFVGDPINLTDPMNPTVNYQYVAPNQTNINNATYPSLTDFIADYTQYDSITFDSSVTITIDETLDADLFSEEYNCYVIPLFNIITDSITITFVGTEEVKFAIFNSGEITLNNNQCGYYYTQDSSTLMVAVATTIESQVQNP